MHSGANSRLKKYRKHQKFSFKHAVSFGTETPDTKYIKNENIIIIIIIIINLSEDMC